MKKTDQSTLAFPLTPALPQADDHTLMPGEFAGMYQRGFEAGYKSGREAGYQQGFNDGFSSKRESAGQPAAIDEMRGEAQHRVAVMPLPVEGQPARKHEQPCPDTRNRLPGLPKRMLLGLPCAKCRCCFDADEMHCPLCGTPRVTTGVPASATHGG